MVETLAHAGSRALSSISSKFYQVQGFDYKTFKTVYDAVVKPVNPSPITQIF